MVEIGRAEGWPYLFSHGICGPKASLQASPTSPGLVLLPPSAAPRCLQRPRAPLHRWPSRGRRARPTGRGPSRRWRQRGGGSSKLWQPQRGQVQMNIGNIGHLAVLASGVEPPKCSAAIQTDRIKELYVCPHFSPNKNHANHSNHLMTPAPPHLCLPPCTSSFQTHVPSSKPTPHASHFLSSALSTCWVWIILVAN